jgi:hypothetical protein
VNEHQLREAFTRLERTLLRLLELAERQAHEDRVLLESQLRIIHLLEQSMKPKGFVPTGLSFKALP